MSNLQRFEKNASAVDINFIAGNSGGNVGPTAGGIINFTGLKSAYVLGDPTTHTLTIWGTPNYLVDANGNAPFTTIQSAMTQANTDGASASNPKVIVVRSGAYNELTITVPCAGLTLVSWEQSQNRRNVPVGSSILTPSVVITGTITTAFAFKVQGVGFFGGSGIDSLVTTAAVNVQIENSSFQANNGLSITPFAGSKFYVSNSYFGPQTGSTVDAFAAGTAFCTYYLDDVHIEQSLPITIPGNFYISNSSIINRFNIATADTCYFNIQNSYCSAGSSNPFITTGSSNTLQIDAFNSEMTGSTNVLSFTGSGSFLNLHLCYLNGNISPGTAVNNTYIACSQFNTTDGAWHPISQSEGNAVLSSLVNTGTASVQAHHITQPAGGDPSTHWTIAGGNTFCQGIKNTDADSLVMTYSASGSVSPEIGTQIWRIDGSTLVTTYSEPIISPGGVTVTNPVPSTPYTVALTERFLCVNTNTVAVTINFPAQPPVGTQFTVADITGNAATHNITVGAVGGLNSFDAGATDVLNTGWAKRTYTYVGGLLYKIG